MKYYIYGKGVNGEGIVSFLGLYFPNQSYAFIDDSKEESSLINLLAHIQQEDRILIASTLHYEKIEENLTQYHLENYENGIIWCGEILNQKLKDYKESHCFKKYIGLVVCKWTEKHFVDLESQLKALGYGVIYFTFYSEIYKKYAKKNFCLFAPHAVLERVVEVEMMLLTNLTPTNEKVISIDITHGFQGSLVYPFMKFSLTDKAFLKYSYSTANYIVCGSKKIHRAYEEFFQSIQEKPTLLDTGYLKLDKDVQEFEKFCKKQQVAGIKSQNDIVIFAFTFFDEIARMIVLMKECFRLNLRVFFKPHPVYAEKLMPKILEAFAGEKLFIEEMESKELFYHSLCVVTDCSSMGYTYPLTTAKPSLILGDNKQEIDKSEKYYEEKLMVSCSKDEDFREFLQEIIATQESYPVKVKIYRQNECFNFANATKSLVEQIELILGD
ncbi:hypothetical protein [uncultured Helicobacter sp.]|uniref:hypothetical protein n=1 Tax=uncultured Helicobacter sp. TaxID=175537 RepID=UPI0026209E99|nr:hypothetical protein [uncultured Helicobacter sp.]